MAGHKYANWGDQVSLRIFVRAYGELRRAIGDDLFLELEEGMSLGDLITKLKGKVDCSGETYLGSFKLEDSSLVVLVNGRNMWALNGIDTPLKDGDHITFMPVVVGG